jgi:chemotaxis-related protein WspD
MATNPATSIPPESDSSRGCKPGDDHCWSYIGVSGDRTCPELSSYIHCRNCPVFAVAARTFFDRPAPAGYLADWAQWLVAPGGWDARDEGSGEQETEAQSHEERVSVLIFRLGSEWLAFRTQAVGEVTTLRPVHIVPHRTNEVLLGLVNLQGQVELCVSLHGLLGVTATSTPVRLVVLRDHNRAECWVFAADEVLGIRHVPRSRWRSLPSTLINPAIGFSQAVLSWNERSIGLLDEERVFTALRSLKP